MYRYTFTAWTTDYVQLLKYYKSICSFQCRTWEILGINQHVIVCITWKAEHKGTVLYFSQMRETLHLHSLLNTILSI